MRIGPLLALLCAACLAAPGAGADPGFYLRPHDRVVWYGDSITEDARYTRLIETYVLTRFPGLDVRFFPAGVGGDRATGSRMGTVEDRLKVDVIPYRPTVLTVMLGVNDGGHRPFDQAIYDGYADGFRKMVAAARAAIPGLRIVLLRPVAYDDVTRPPAFEGGYNGVLVRFGDALSQLGRETGCDVADMNAPMVRALQAAREIDPAGAPALISDRVHPGPGGHLLMASFLLEAWRAPRVVATVELDAAAQSVAASENTSVTGLTGGPSGLAWKQLDRALPLPIDASDPTTVLALRLCDLAPGRNVQRLRVTGLGRGSHALRIDGVQVGVFAAGEFARGIDLTALDTPMMQQARQVAWLTDRHHYVFMGRWRNVWRPLRQMGTRQVRAALDAMTALEEDLVRQQRAAARPAPHRFEIVPAATRR